MTLKIKIQGFSQYTEAKHKKCIMKTEDFNETAQKLWELRPYNKNIRLLGLSLSNLNTEEKNKFLYNKIPLKNSKRIIIK